MNTNHESAPSAVALLGRNTMKGKKSGLSNGPKGSPTASVTSGQAKFVPKKRAVQRVAIT